MALLSVADIRGAIDTSLSDARLQDLLDATEQDILAAAGAVAEQTEYAYGGYSALVLTRPIGTVTSVTEESKTLSELELAADDYWVDGYILRRLDTGTNPRRTWNGLVEVVHAPASDTAERKRAQVALVRLDLAAAAGVASERIGDYAIGYANTSGGTNYQQQRQLILDSLKPVMVG